jgi:hypothetical protein
MAIVGTWSELGGLGRSCHLFTAFQAGPQQSARRRRVCDSAALLPQRNASVISGPQQVAEKASSLKFSL